MCHSLSMSRSIVMVWLPLASGLLAATLTLTTSAEPAAETVAVTARTAATTIRPRITTCLMAFSLWGEVPGPGRRRDQCGYYPRSRRKRQEEFSPAGGPASGIIIAWQTQDHSFPKVPHEQTALCAGG